MRLFLLLFFLPVTLFCQVTEDKRGGICFRYDDNTPKEKLEQMEAVFRKYNSKFCMALNMAALPDQVGYPRYLKRLDTLGYEIMDHCPNHGTGVFWIDPADMKIYKNKPGVDHLNEVGMVCLSYEKINPNNYEAHGYMDISKDTLVSKKAGGFKDYSSDYFIYLPMQQQLGNPYLILNRNPSNPDTILIHSFWSEQINLGKKQNVEFNFVNYKYVNMTPEAVCILGQESMRLFEKYGLARPVSWIQPGGKTSKLSARLIKNTYGDKLGYLGGATDGGLQCYNDPSAEVARFAMQWGDFSGGLDEIKNDETVIANQIARHYFLIGGTHSAEVPDWKNYLVKVDSILSWCYREKIPVKTYRDWATLLYDTPQNPYTNIFPVIKCDKDHNGVPDGYDLNEGAVDKQDSPVPGEYSLSSRKSGSIFRINNLAGLEKGENEFYLWTKGGKDNFITVTFSFQETGKSLTYRVPANTREWTRYSLGQLAGEKPLMIPEDCAYLHVEVTCPNLKEGEVKVGGFRLNKKLDAPLYVTSKTDTVRYTDENFKYRVSVAKYYLKDTLAFALVDAPSWLKIDQYGVITNAEKIEAGSYAIQVNVADQSGNNAEYVFKIRFTERPSRLALALRSFISNYWTYLAIGCAFLVCLCFMFFMIRNPILKELKVMKDQLASIEKLIDSNSKDRRS